MTFPTPSERTATTVSRIQVELWDQIDDEEQSPQGAHYRVIVLDQNGQRIHRAAYKGQLLPHLTTEQKQWLSAFMTSLRDQAETAFLEVE